jgi:hypothetical protein
MGRSTNDCDIHGATEAPGCFGQVHLDIHVADIAAAEAKVLALGATRLPSTEPGFRVYADPAGHPFCLEWG